VASTRSAAPRSASRVRPWGNAMRWLLTGDEFNAAEALRIGLVQGVVEPGTQLDWAVELATRIAGEAAPLGVRTTALSARRAIADGAGAAARRLTRNVADLFPSEDAAEGVCSFGGNCARPTSRGASSHLVRARGDPERSERRRDQGHSIRGAAL
jgi:enoyl-CoA hydratase/carnithine racemase